MKKKILKVVWVVLLICGLRPLAVASSAVRVVLTFASISEREGILFVANDQQFFRKYGLDVQLVYVSSGQVSMSALSSGDSDLNTGSVSGATLGVIVGGSDVVCIAGLINKLTGIFVVSPQIKSPADLKGKRISVTSIGGGNWVFAMLALRHWGLDPERDGITVRVIGNDAARAQAIVTGAFEGTHLGYAYGPALKKQGIRILADVADLGIPYQSTAVFTKRSFLRSSPETAEKVLRALVDAIDFIQNPANKTAVMKSLAKGLRLSRVEDAEEGYETMKTLYDKRIFPNVEGVRNTIQLLGTLNPKIGRLRVEDIIDDRIVKKLEKEGLF